MSHMSTLYFEIQEDLSNGYSFKYIAERLNISIDYVRSVFNQIYGDENGI